jgi:K(+)-stimulated pyrophosphate-energized sodium pump
MVRAVGVFASIIGAMCVRGKDDQNFNPMRPIQSGFVISAAVSTIGFGIINYYYLNHDWRFFFATFSGIILAIVISFLTEYYTATEYRPVKETTNATKTGAATTILSGFSAVFTVYAVFAIGATILFSAFIFKEICNWLHTGARRHGYAHNHGYCGHGHLWPDLGPANGILECQGCKNQGPAAHHIIAKLDAVGNTTKAVTKGFAIASAVVAAVSLFQATEPLQKMAPTSIFQRNSSQFA